MSLHVSEKTKEKRKAQIDEIKNQVDFIIEKYEEEIYKIIKKKGNTEEKVSQIYDQMILAFEEVISFTIEEVKEFYPNSFNKNEVVVLKDILYQEDEKILYDRIEERFIDGPQKNQENFRRMNLIIETDGHRVMYQVIKKKTKSDITYVLIVYGGGRMSDRSLS